MTESKVRKAFIKSLTRQGYTDKEIAQRMNITHQRVSQIRRQDTFVGVWKPKPKPKKDKTRHCNRCKVVITARKNWCEDCYPIRRQKMKNRNYKNNAEARARIIERNEVWRKANPDKVRVSSLRAVKAYYQRNRSKMLEYNHQRYLKIRNTPELWEKRKAENRRTYRRKRIKERRKEIYVSIAEKFKSIFR